MAAANSATDTKRDDLVAGLAAVEARLDAMDRKLVEGFNGIEKLLDAKLTPVIQASAEQQKAVMDHERRLTCVETILEKEIGPVANEMKTVRLDVQSLQEHASRCDERSKAAGNRWWGVAQGIILAVVSLIIGWLGATFWAGLGR